MGTIVLNAHSFIPLFNRHSSTIGLLRLIEECVPFCYKIWIILIFLLIWSWENKKLTENVYENTEYVYDPITTQVPYEYKSDVAQTGMSAQNHIQNIYFSFKVVYWKRFLYNSHLFYSQWTQSICGRNEDQILKGFEALSQESKRSTYRVIHWKLVSCLHNSLMTLRITFNKNISSCNDVDIFYRNKKSGLVIKRKRKIGWQSESTDSPLTLVVDGNIHTPTVRRNVLCNI